MMRIGLVRLALCSLLMFGSTGPLVAQTEPPVLAIDSGEWTPAKAFGRVREGKTDDEAREAISGAACAPTLWCIVVNDEKEYAQFFTIAGTTLVPDGKVIRLVPRRSGFNELDLEGASFVRRAGGKDYFYLVGSHAPPRDGRPDKELKPVDPSRYWLFRLPLDAATGKPTFPYSDDSVDAAVERTNVLGPILKTLPEIGPMVDKYDTQNGLNIEGLAVREGKIHLGLRSPVLLQAGIEQAFIVTVDDADALGAIGGNPKADPVALGPGQGIRDLAAVSDGVLILSGPSGDVDDETRHAVFHWTPKSATQTTAILKSLGRLGGLPKGAKAETLLVLEDLPGQPYRVLVMMDGIADGNPVSYRIPR